MRTFLAAVALLLLTAEAHAGLTGQAVTASYRYPTASDTYALADWMPPTFIVGSGQETDGNIEDVTHILVDFTDNTLTLTLLTSLSSPTWNSAAFNGPVFSADAALGISAATVDAATTMAGFDGSRVSFTDDTILLDWGGLSYQNGTTIRIDFVVPEPASLSLLGVGLVVLSQINRRRLRPTLAGR